MTYIETFLNGYAGYASYLWQEITHPSFHNYFYWLVGVSLLFLVLEIVVPWRKGQPLLRRDFYLDLFYMFFNFFLFSLIVYNAASDVVVKLFNDGIRALSGFDLQAFNPMGSWPIWAILLTGFVVRDFIQWWVHRLLHRVPRLWEFHKVHHSVQEMGFAAHLRYHWMENVVYRTLEYIPLALLGIGLHDFFIIHIFTLAWGHYNHANISIPRWVTGSIVGTLIGTVVAFGLLDLSLFDQDGIVFKIMVVLGGTLLGAVVLGPVMKYLFNSPEMHIWHHAHHLPEGHQYGVNYGLTLAIWDYVFKTASMPHDGKDIDLGFPGVDRFPTDFVNQNLNGFNTFTHK